MQTTTESTAGTAHRTRTLGHTGLHVLPLMLGGNVFGWTIDQDRSFAILDRFAGRGFNFIDTADVYSRWKPGNHVGESETVLGNWFKRSGKRDQIVIATKVGMDMGDGKQGLRRQRILDAADASLRRLQTDHIDLYQSHKDDEATPIDETLEAYQRLIQQGKVRAIGASNFKADRLSEALRIAKENGLPAYETLQPEYNLYDRQDYETNLAAVAAENGFAVVPYFSLASGFLTGKYQTLADTKGANRASRVEKYFDDRGMKILKALAQVEQETGAHQASISLAWLLAQPTITAPIASATSTTQLDDLFAAVDLQLTPDQIRTLTVASAY